MDSKCPHAKWFQMCWVRKETLFFLLKYIGKSNCFLKCWKWHHGFLCTLYFDMTALVVHELWSLPACDLRLWYLFCSCFVVFSLKSLITGRQSGPGEILRCDYGWLLPRNLEIAALYHICSVTANSGFACQEW